jgi:hypothetical protein
MDHISQLTQPERDELFQKYKEAHAEHGIDFTEDQEIFEANLMYNLQRAYNISQFLTPTPKGSVVSNERHQAAEN